MIAAHTLVGQLAAAGWVDYSGVPCSILNTVHQEVASNLTTRYIPACVEGEALAIGVGHWLGGKASIALMQNSGLGNVINPLTSLAIPYRIPVLLVVSWRGQPGIPDESHHSSMGAATLGLLDLLGVPYWVLDGATCVESVIAAAIHKMETCRIPVALIVPRSTLTNRAVIRESNIDPCSVDLDNKHFHRAVPCVFGSGPWVDRTALVAAVVESFPNDLIISTTGYMSRTLAALGPYDHHFYMQGSMGFAVAIGLGVARTCPTQRVFVLDGDGALLMRLGSLSTIGHAGPRNLVHIVADNRSYASTGGQAAASVSTSFPEVALACGYKRAASCIGIDGLQGALCWAASEPGPTLLHVLISKTETTDHLNRPTLKPENNAQRFRKYVMEMTR